MTARCCLLLVVLAVGGEFASAMDFVKLSADKKGFVLDPSGERYVPWGHNYASVDILERLAREPERVEREFAAMKAAGTTVARVHPEMPAFFDGPGKVNAAAIQRLRQLLGIAEKSGIYLHITGLACYQINGRLAWYDALDDEARWKAQEFFWSTIAQTCASSPAVFCYDLANEPAAGGKRAESWYLGRMGDVEFCQRLTLDQPQRAGDDIFAEWTRRMIAAIRQHDQKRLITLGMLPFPGAYKAAAAQLDFISPHLYPKSNKVDEEIELLKKFDFGKPIVIGETFPLSCSAAEEREFLLKSRGLAQGWIGHWPDESPQKLQELKQQGEIDLKQSIWLSWVELFREIGPEMKK
jgi:cellulase (glycosyl hydrolase family 5)